VDEYKPLAVGHLRDCVQGGMEAVIGNLTLLPHLIAVADPVLHAAIFPASAHSSFSDSGLAERRNAKNEEGGAGGGGGDVDGSDDDGFVMVGGRGLHSLTLEHNLRTLRHIAHVRAQLEHPQETFTG